jgi:hypothetical protein
MSPLRYAILHHGGIDPPHVDLLFETLPGSMLAAFRCPAWPIESAAPLTRLRDHRRLYLTYEGEIPGQRGNVTRLAAGDCALDIGEGDVWTLCLLNGAAPATLILRKLSGDQWEARAQ